MSSPTSSSLRILFALLLVALMAGCGDPKMVSYQIPKEREGAVAGATAGASSGMSSSNPIAPTAGDAMSGTAVVTAAGVGLRWTAPTHWQSKPASAMRKGSYVVSGENGAVADLSITAFPGDVGGETANVNRWRGQIQLAPLADSEIAASVIRFESHTLSIAVADCANTSSAAPQRIIGAIVPFEGATWFFKLVGPDALVAKEKPAFLEFLKTVQPVAPIP